MRKEDLITALWAYKGGSKSITDILTAVDAYSSASNGAKPDVSGALPLDELDSAAERYLIPNYFTDVPTIEEEIKEFNELKEAFKAGYLLRQ